VARILLQVSSKSPVTNKPLAHTHLAVNHTLRKIMLEWMEAHQPHNVSVATGKAISKKKKKMRLNRVDGKKRSLDDEDE
jgi:ribonuclease HI